MDHSILVSLEDIETDMIYTTHLSRKDAHRVKTGKKWEVIFPRCVIYVIFKSAKRFLGCLRVLIHYLFSCS